MYRLLCEHKSSFLWDKCPGLQLLACMRVACLAKKTKTKKLPNSFRVVLPFHIRISNPVLLHPCWYLVLSLFFISVILIGVHWYLIKVLIWISLMSNDIEHLFICLFAICMSSVKLLFTSFAHFLIGLVFMFIPICSL